MIKIISLFVVIFIGFAECNKEPKFAPYIFISKDLEFKLVDFHNQHGINAFSLAFALGGAEGCLPQWYDGIPLNDTNVIKEIKAFRALGGELIVSTGGAGGIYLENACRSVQELTTAYNKVLEVTGATGLDVDVEIPLPLDTVNQALAAVQKQNPKITVSFTVPTQGDDYGMNDPYGVDVLKNAVKHGVRVDVVNVMVMNFHTSQVGRPYGEAMTYVAQNAVKQMAKIWPQKSDSELYGMVGLTPMLGLNDNQELFTMDDARHVVQWAKQNKIGHLGFWSINRDRQCSGGASLKWQTPLPNCSSIKQQDFEFTNVFKTF